jgi:uncharacterized membrane protein YcaP (DUF421 family)
VNKTLGILLGVLSLEPLGFFAMVAMWLLPSVASGSLFRERFHRLVPFALATAILVVSQLVIYALILARRTSVSIVEKVCVPACIFISNGIVLPFVWWLYEWKRSDFRALFRR